MSKLNDQIAEIVLPCGEMDESLTFISNELGFRNLIGAVSDFISFTAIHVSVDETVNQLSYFVYSNYTRGKPRVSFCSLYGNNWYHRRELHWKFIWDHFSRKFQSYHLGTQVP